MPESFKKYVDIILVLLFISALVLLAWLHTGAVDKAREDGYNAGVQETSNRLNKVMEDDRKKRELEKSYIEKSAGEQINAAKVDADTARGAADRLQQELSSVRDLVGQYTPSDTAGKTARQAVVVLGDLLKRHIDRNRELAEFADQAYTAGITCERQYDSLMVEYGKVTTPELGRDIQAR